MEENTKAVESNPIRRTIFDDHPLPWRTGFESDQFSQVWDANGKNICLVRPPVDGIPGISADVAKIIVGAVNSVSPTANDPGQSPLQYAQSLILEENLLPMLKDLGSKGWCICGFLPAQMPPKILGGQAIPAYLCIFVRPLLNQARPAEPASA